MTSPFYKEQLDRQRNHLSIKQYAKVHSIFCEMSLIVKMSVLLNSK